MKRRDLFDWKGHKRAKNHLDERHNNLPNEISRAVPTANRRIVINYRSLKIFPTFKGFDCRSIKGRGRIPKEHIHKLFECLSQFDWPVANFSLHLTPPPLALPIVALIGAAVASATVAPCPSLSPTPPSPSPAGKIVTCSFVSLPTKGFDTSVSWTNWHSSAQENTVTNCQNFQQTGK